jgi:hypothetical protein
MIEPLASELPGYFYYYARSSSDPRHSSAERRLPRYAEYLPVLLLLMRSTRGSAYLARHRCRDDAPQVLTNSRNDLGATADANSNGLDVRIRIRGDTPGSLGRVQRHCRSIRRQLHHQG